MAELCYEEDSIFRGEVIFIRGMQKKVNENSRKNTIRILRIFLTSDCLAIITGPTTAEIQ